MADRRRWTLWTAVALAAGCAHRPESPAARSTLVLTERAALPIEATGPAPRLPARSTTRPHGRPPVDALVAYAAGQDAIARGDTAVAVAQFRLAADLDPDRFDVQYALGQALVQANAPEAQAVAALTRAAGQDPGRIDVWTELGRLHLSAHEPAAAVTDLRTALLTPGYAADSGQAAVVDLLLARALTADGFDRAAIDRYAVLLRRFKDPTLSVRDQPDLITLTEHPDALFEPIGRLYDRHAEWATALQAYTAAAAQSPDRFELQVAMAIDRAQLGRSGDPASADAAVRQAAELVVRDAAAPATLRLLDDVCHTLGRPTVDELQRIAAAHPTDRAVHFAAADALVAAGRPNEADAVLADAWHHPGDLPIARRLATLYRRQGRTAEAARLIIVTSTANPDVTAELARTWDALLRPDQPHRLTAEAVAALTVPPGDEPARQFWLARTAANHAAAAAAALDRAIAAEPPFAPAVRARVDGMTPGSADVEALASRLSPPLAAMVRARSFVAAGRPAEAAAAAAEADRLGDHSPATGLLLAQTAHARVAIASPGPDAAYAQALTRLVLENPTDEEAYLALFGYWVDPQVAALDRGLQVLNAWRTSDPDDVTARLLQARTDHQLNNVEPADAAIEALLQSDGDDPDVLTAAAAVFGDRGDVLADKLEADHAAHPRSGDVAAELAGVYARAGRRGDAARVLDATRAASAGDAGVLYPMANVYAALGQPGTAEAVLEQVLSTDPGHAGASNDLGFAWADAGRNLGRAEALIRTAVAAEPQNTAFLDSLGWVLYKRGRFAEARPVLERAAGPTADAADPAVLDHLGDTLYRLDRPADARQAWERALSALGRGGDGSSTLRLQLRQKVRQAVDRRSVDVAPVATGPGGAVPPITN